MGGKVRWVREEGRRKLMQAEGEPAAESGTEERCLWRVGVVLERLDC